jgi:hypothetical protein
MFGRGQAQGCRRCSNCSIHYPPQQRFEVCDVCEEPTSYFNNVEPDQEWEEAVKYARLHPSPRATADPHEYRFEEYLKMGFNEHQAQALANAVYGQHAHPLYTGTVQAALDAGCDLAVCFDMFA